MFDFGENHIMDEQTKGPKVPAWTLLVGAFVILIAVGVWIS